MRKREKKTSTVVVRLPDELKEKIKKLAQKRNISSGEAVRLAVQFFLAVN